MNHVPGLGALLVAGCIAQAANAVNPPATGQGTLTCGQIVEQCDAQCTDPLCVRRCGDQGTAVAAAQHDAVVDCAQRNGCTDEDCIRASCAPEADACQGAVDPAAPTSSTAPEPDSPSSAPGNP